MIFSDYPFGIAFEYWLGQNDLWRDPKVMRWTPWRNVAARRSFVKKPLREYMFPILAEAAADISRAGGFVTVGAHGEQDGLGTHWELWSMAMAMTPMEALEAASLHGAHALGLDRDVGSIEVGKLADLVVLNSNPLQDIRRTTDIRYVVKGGVLYDAETLDELWPAKRSYGFRPWLDRTMTVHDDRSDSYWDESRSSRTLRRRK